MRQALTKPNYTFSILFIISVFFSSNLSSQTFESTVTSACGTMFNLSTDHSNLIEEGYIDIDVTSNDNLGIFNSCDIEVPIDTPYVEQADHGLAAIMEANGECFIRYTRHDPNHPDYDAFAVADSFEYVMTIADTCGMPTGYCDAGAGKIWTINSAYYGPAGASVVVSAKNGPNYVDFVTVTDLVPNTDFFINGTSLVKNTNWRFKFYADGASEPFNTADVHTSCSADIFGVDFGVFRPINGCVAPAKDKGNCVIEGSATISSKYRNASVEVTSYTTDTTMVYLVLDFGLLPIDFSFFQGMAVKENNLLEWGIELVVDEERMILEKSTDGVNFTALTYYTNLQRGNFEFTDTKVTTERSYYRFKMVNVNGNETYSRSISINNKNVGTGTINVFPVPTMDVINYAADKTISNIMIIDLTGKLIYSQPQNSNSVQLNTANLNIGAGVYFTNITLEDGSVITKKLSVVN